MYTRQNAIVIMILIAISPDFPHISPYISIQSPGPLSPKVTVEPVSPVSPRGPVKPSMATAAEAFGTRLGSCDATRGTMRCSDCGWAQQKPGVVTSDVTREFP